MQDIIHIQKAWIKLLSQAMENEAAIGWLYGCYAAQFPKQAETWAVLARAEEKHRASLEGILSGAVAELAQIPMEKLQAGTLDFITSQIAVMLEKATAGDVTETRAVANALLLESALVESFLFSAAPAADDSPFRKVAEQLYRESLYHRQIVLGLSPAAPDNQAAPLWRGETVIAPPAVPSRIAAAMARQTVLAGMVRHEKTVARLYGEYARLFPAAAAFWNGLAGEEAEHAAILARIGERIAAGELDFSADRFALETIRSSTAFIEEQIAAAQRGPVTEDVALGIASTVENQTIENDSFRVFTEESASPEIRAMFADIHRQELRHRADIAKRMEEAAAKPGLWRRLFGGK